MKIFTKSVLVAVAMMAGATTANAQSWIDDSENWVELTGADWHQWKGEVDGLGFEACDKNASMVMNPDDPSVPATAAITDSRNSDIGAGTAIFGAANIEHNTYADISDYDYLIIFGSCSGENPGDGMRIMCNRIHVEGAWKQVNTNFFSEINGQPNEYYNADLGCLAIPISIFKTIPVNQNDPDPAQAARQAEIDAGIGKGAERVDDFVHLHCLKNAWGGSFPINVSSIYVWKAGGETAIKTIKNEVAEDGAYYNLQGQRVDNPAKGLFIHNGKKVILK